MEKFTYYIKARNAWDYMQIGPFNSKEEAIRYAKKEYPSHSPEDLVGIMKGGKVVRLYPFEGLGNYKKKAIRTWEYREPKAWEYYLSGANPTAYKAPNDLWEKFWIAQEAVWFY